MVLPNFTEGIQSHEVSLPEAIATQKDLVNQEYLFIFLAPLVKFISSKEPFGHKFIKPKYQSNSWSTEIGPDFSNTENGQKVHQVDNS